MLCYFYNYIQNSSTQGIHANGRLYTIFTKYNDYKVQLINFV